MAQQLVKLYTVFNSTLYYILDSIHYRFSRSWLFCYMVLEGPGKFMEFYGAKRLWTLLEHSRAMSREPANSTYIIIMPCQKIDVGHTRGTGAVTSAYRTLCSCYNIKTPPILTFILGGSFEPLFQKWFLQGWRIALCFSKSPKIIWKW